MKSVLIVSENSDLGPARLFRTGTENITVMSRATFEDEKKIRGMRFDAIIAPEAFRGSDKFYASLVAVSCNEAHRIKYI